MSYNPLAIFQYQMLDGFFRRGQRYFVSQTYNRAKNHFEEGVKNHLLLSHYDDIGLAQNHFHVIRHDANARIYDGKNDQDMRDLKTLFTTEAGNKIFTKLIADPKWDEKMKTKFKPNIQKWIIANTKWTISRDSALPIKFHIIFGEFFITLKWKNEERRIRFEEIERA